MAEIERTPIVEGETKSVDEVSPGKRKLVESAISSPMKKQLKGDDNNVVGVTEETKESGASVSDSDTKKSVIEDESFKAPASPAVEKTTSKDGIGSESDPDVLVINEGLEAKAQDETKADEVEVSRPEATKNGMPEDAVEAPQAEVTA